MSGILQDPKSIDLLSPHTSKAAKGSWLHLIYQGIVSMIQERNFQECNINLVPNGKSEDRNIAFCTGREQKRPSWLSRAGRGDKMVLGKRNLLYGNLGERK